MPGDNLGAHSDGDIALGLATLSNPPRRLDGLTATSGKGGYERFAKVQSRCEAASAAAFCERQGHFTSSPTPLSKMSPPTSQLNIWGSSLRITLSPSQEPTTTSGKPMAINTMLERL